MGLLLRGGEEKGGRRRGREGKVKQKDGERRWKGFGPPKKLGMGPLWIKV